jgi:hypothetical protein
MRGHERAWKRRVRDDAWQHIARAAFRALPDLRHEHVHALNVYSGPDSYIINSALRSGRQLTAVQQTTVGLLDEAFAVAPRTARPMTLMRSVSTLDDDTFMGYTSTSLWEHDSEPGDDSIVLSLHVPAGTPFIAMDLIAHDLFAGPDRPPVAGPSQHPEREILLPRATSWAIERTGPKAASATLRSIIQQPQPAIDSALRERYRSLAADRAAQARHRLAGWWSDTRRIAAEDACHGTPVPRSADWRQFDLLTPLHSYLNRVDAATWNRAWATTAPAVSERVGYALRFEDHHPPAARRELAAQITAGETAMVVIADQLTRERAVPALVSRDTLADALAYTWWEDQRSVRPLPFDEDAIEISLSRAHKDR